jgi:protein required for attachment to host cells
MDKLSVGHGDLVVVCDGRKALILENKGDNNYPNLRRREPREQYCPAARDLGTERPGRVHESIGNARSAVNVPDLHEEAERIFLRSLADDLHAIVANSLDPRLVLVAPPHALGWLRDVCSPTVRKATVAQVSKDWVNEPINKIERRLFSRQSSAEGGSA